MKEYCLAVKNLMLDFMFKSSERIIFTTFLLLCVFGGVLLVLPCSGNLSFIDALFSSFSGVCVTGLSVIDISKDLTILGQVILLMLIQVGGLSIMSISSIIFFLLGKRMSLSYEKTARNMFNADSSSEIKESLFSIFKYTFVVELLGIIILFFRIFMLEHNILFALKHSIFLAISAFCNAGFTLFSKNLITYANDEIILFTISILIILGGIAPAIVFLFPKYLRREKLPPMFLIVFRTTIFLLIFGTFVYYIAEYNNTLEGMNFIDKISNSWFQSATTRTAGFNSVSLNSLNDTTYVLFLFLMVIGGSPGGMAGGIKTTTFAILAITCYNTILGRKNIIRNKEIAPETIYKAISLIFVYVGIIILSTTILLTTQTIPTKKLLFEVVSAIGTVGLSMDITPYFNIIGKIVIITTMFLGRVLPAIFICYLNSKTKEVGLSYPQAKILLT